MTATNDFLQFCQTDTGTNLEEQAAYLADPVRLIGNQPGVASSAFVNKALRQATAMASALAQYVCNVTGSDMPDDGETATLIANMGAAFSGSVADLLSNLTISATVSGNAMTINVLSAAATTPSSSNVCYVGVRSATLTAGTYNIRSVVAATTIVIPSGTTIGTVSATPSTVFVYLIDNAGTMELAVSLTQFSENQVITTSAVSSGASATTMYSTSARTSVPFRLIGQVTSTQSVAGTWAASPTQLQLTPFQKAPVGTAFAAKTSAYTVTLADQAITADDTSASFTITLPTAASATGKTYIFQKINQTFAHQVTIAGNGSETINGVNTTTINTQYETLTITSTGTAWVINQRYIPSVLANAGVNVFTATTTNPTKGSVQTVDRVLWNRNGQYLELIAEFVQSNGSGSAAGSGDYIFGLPSALSGITFDSTMVTFYTSVLAGTASQSSNVIGSGSVSSNAPANWQCTASAYDSTHWRLMGLNSTTNGCPGAGTFPITNNAATYVSKLRVPITNWKF